MKLTIPENVCDSHIHIGYFPQLQVTFTLEQVSSIMKKYMISSALVFSSWFEATQETDKILKALEKDKKLFALIRSNIIDYTSEDFLRSLEKLLKSNPQVVGMKINSSTEKHKATDSRYQGCLEVLNDQEAVLLLHCGRWVEMSGWQHGLKVAQKYPKIKVIFAHMGGTHPELAFPAMEAAKNIPNIYFDTSQTRQLIVIKRGIEQLGASRLLFASDMPWGNYIQNLVGLIELELKESVMNKLMRENFNRIIKEG